MSRYARAALPGLTCLLGACVEQLPPANLYVLTTESAAANAASGPARTVRRTRLVVLAPIEIPEYLARPEIVYRTSATSLASYPDARWAEPLHAGVQRVLESDLASRLSPAYALVPGRSGNAVDQDISVSIERFERDANGQVILSANWTVRGPSAGAAPRRGRKTYQCPAADSAESQAASMSDCLAELAADLAGQVMGIAP